MTDWISEGLNSLDFTLAALVTQNLPSSGMYSSQGSAFVPSNSSSKLSAWKLPILIPIRVFLMKDQVTVGLDSTGVSLHKRGYRKLVAQAPIAENLAVRREVPLHPRRDVRRHHGRLDGDGAAAAERIHKHPLPVPGSQLDHGRRQVLCVYRAIGERFRLLDTWSMYLISAYEGAERDIGRKADRNRKIYNGMMKAYYYQFLGPKPPRAKQ